MGTIGDGYPINLKSNSGVVMAASEIDLTDASPLSSVFTFTIDSPSVEAFQLKHNDQVVLLHSMDGGDPENYQVAYIYDRSEKKIFPNIKAGEKGQLKLLPFDVDANRTIKCQVQS